MSKWLVLGLVAVAGAVLALAPPDIPGGAWIAEARAAIVSHVDVEQVEDWLGRAKAAINADDEPPEPAYRYAPVERGDMVSTVVATGAVAPVATVLVSSQISGQIKEIYADFNTEVKPGDVIALIDPTTFQNAAAIAEGELAIATAGVVKAQVALRDAEADLQRKRTLAASGSGSLVDLSKAQTLRDLAQAALQEANAVVVKDQAGVKQAQTDVERTRIRSPVNGMVISRNIEAGQTVAASLQAPVLYTIAQDLRDMQVNASVDESEIGRIQPGQKVEFTVDSYPGRRFSGEVFQIRKAAQTVQNVVTYTVVVHARNPDLALMPGMTASARFIVAQRQNIAKVPNAALRFRQAGTPLPGKQARIWIEDGETVRVLPVKVGLSDGTKTEISGEGIGPGMRVVIGQQSVKQGRSTAKRLIGVM